MNAFALSTVVSALASAIACGHTAEELALLSSLFVQLGDTLATVAAEEALREAKGGAAPETTK